MQCGEINVQVTKDMEQRTTGGCSLARSMPYLRDESREVVKSRSYRFMWRLDPYGEYETLVGY
jgi:hypothetical protein